MSDAATNEDLLTVGSRSDISLLLYHAGFGNEQVTLTNKTKAIQCILHHQVFVSRRDAITDLKNGLDTANFLDLLTTNSGCLELIFPLSHEVRYGANDITALIDNSSLTNISDKEREVFEWFTHYLTVLEEGGLCCVFFRCWSIIVSNEYYRGSYDMQGKMKFRIGGHAV